MLHDAIHKLRDDYKANPDFLFLKEFVLSNLGGACACCDGVSLCTEVYGGVCACGGGVCTCGIGGSVNLQDTRNVWVRVGCWFSKQRLTRHSVTHIRSILTAGVLKSLTRAVLTAGALK